MKSLFADVVARIVEMIFGIFGIAAFPFSRNWMGLGNRVKGVGNFYARGYRKFFLVWNDVLCVTEPFSRLFTLDGCKVWEVNCSSWMFPFCKWLIRRFVPSGVVAEEYPYWSFILPPELREERNTYKWKFSERPSHSVDWWFDRTPSAVREYFAPYFNALQPSEAVRRRAADCKFEIGECVCVQIRNNLDPNDEKDVCSVESIIAAMRRYPAETKFFLAYMEKTIGARVAREFAGRTCELPNKDCNSMIDTVAEMWLLGHGKALLASPSSTFSEVAWWWGGAKIPVIMLESEYNQRSMPK